MVTLFKKPALWIVVVAVLAVVAARAGLMGNTQKGQLTVEDYAGQYVQEVIAAYDTGAFKITESKITKLEKIASFEQLLPATVLEIWSLEYRLKPDDISKVMLAGGMHEIDGWITEEASMGKPILIFAYENAAPQLLGTAWSGAADFSTTAGQETALRIFLEERGLLPNVTFSGSHIVIKFPLSTGETSQLLLSQPVVQGDRGIWCVERWMDGNGTVYHVTPETAMMIADYYRELQKQSDQGSNTALLDPLQVALDFINNDLGQRVSLGELVPLYSARAEDFLQTPESHFMGFIKNFNRESPSFHLYKIEWLTLEDTERLKELNIAPDDLPNGFYIYTPPQSYPEFFQVKDQTQYSIINWGVDTTHKLVAMDEFVRYLEQYADFAPPFSIVTKDGYVQSITEQYVP